MLDKAQVAGRLNISLRTLGIWMAEGDIPYWRRKKLVRFYWPDVETAADPLDGLVNRYLMEIKCPRTFRDAGESYRADLENRFGYLKQYAREWNVDGVILQSMKYCDTHGYEVPAVKDYIEGLGLPSLFLEHEYTKIALAPLRTRVQAFVEMIGSNH